MAGRLKRSDMKEGVSRAIAQFDETESPYPI